MLCVGTCAAPLAVVGVVRLELRGAPRRCWCCAVGVARCPRRCWCCAVGVARCPSPLLVLCVGIARCFTNNFDSLAVVGVVRLELRGASPTTFVALLKVPRTCLVFNPRPAPSRSKCFLFSRGLSRTWYSPIRWTQFLCNNPGENRPLEFSFFLGVFLL
jgi:hypothetical protein